MMENISIIIATLPLLVFYCVNCINEVSEGNLLSRTNSLRKIQKEFVSAAESFKLTDISLETSDQIMSAEYMFNFLNKLDNSDINKASGIPDSNLEKADTVRSFSSRSNQISHMVDVYRFKIHALSIEEHIKRVELRLRNSEVTRSRKTKVKYIIKQNNEVVLKFRSKEKLHLDGEYFVVDMTKRMKPILQQLHGNVTVQISVKQHKRIRSELKQTNNSHVKENDALMIIFSEDKDFIQQMYEKFQQKNPFEQLLRSKRAIQPKDGRRKRKQCQLENFNVDFNHLGWGQWVVFPKIFNAGICTGACSSPIKEKYTPTNHAMLQSLMRLGSPKVAPMPCCVPTRLKPLKLLYYEKDEIVVRHHEDMVATSCGCR